MLYINFYHLLLQEKQKENEWYQTKVSLKEISFNTRCKKEIPFKNIEKYENTLIALREKKLHQMYRSLTTYRVDEESEGRLTGLTWAFVALSLVFICILAYTGYKIRIFQMSISETKGEIDKEHSQLIEFQDEVIRLRKLKLMQSSIAEEQK